MAAEEGTTTEFAGPFDSNNNLISKQSALISGSFTLLGVALLAASAALLVYGLVAGRSGIIANAPLVALGGSAAVALALVLAIIMYPSEFSNLGVSFWGGDVNSGTPTGFTRADAALGWYLGLGAVFLGTLGGILAMSGQGAAVKHRKAEWTEA